MADSSSRLAYLQALGIEQWVPRFAPESVPEALPEPVLEVEQASVGEASEPVESSALGALPEVEAPEVEAVVGAAVDGVPVSADASSPPPEESRKIDSPSREAVPSVAAEELVMDARRVLAQAAVQWESPPSNGVTLAVLGVDATGIGLKSASFEAERAVLQKMLAAIGQDMQSTAFGGLDWEVPAEGGLGVGFALVLVDMGLAKNAWPRVWQGVVFQCQGAGSVLIPHPRMFAGDPSLRRQAWDGLQLLQKLRA